VPIIHNNKSNARYPEGSKREARPAAALNKALAHREFGRMSNPPKLRLRVDQDKCQGHARCKSLAPELFDLDEFGNAHEVGDGAVPAGLEDKAWLAQTNCPEFAIVVTEE
jgi:ferredoxin